MELAQPKAASRSEISALTQNQAGPHGPGANSQERDTTLLADQRGPEQGRGAEFQLGEDLAQLGYETS